VATQHYLHARYFKAGYFSPSYFAAGSTGFVGQVAITLAGASAAAGGSPYLRPGYFASGYFASGYFGGGAQSAGFLGTFHNNQILQGQISSTLSGAAAAISAVTAQLESLEITISITPNWHSTEYPGFTGSTAVTLDDASSAISGLARAAGAIDGLLSSSLDGATSVISGTHVRPAGRIGVVAATLSDVGSVVIGAVAPPGTFFGAISSSLDGATAVISAQLVIPSRTGSIGASLDGASGLISAISSLSSVRIGSFSVTLDGVTLVATGTGPKFKQAVPRRTIDPRGTTPRIITPRKLH
jgi:hypothetical protein